MKLDNCDLFMRLAVTSVRDVQEQLCAAARMLDAGECVAVVAAAGAATALTTLARGAQCAPAAHSPDLGHGLARHPGQLCVPVGSSA